MTVHVSKVACKNYNALVMEVTFAMNRVRLIVARNVRNIHWREKDTTRWFMKVFTLQFTVESQGELLVELLT